MGIYEKYRADTNRVENLQHHPWALEMYIINKEGITEKRGKQDVPEFYSENIQCGKSKMEAKRRNNNLNYIRK